MSGDKFSLKDYFEKKNVIQAKLKLEKQSEGILAVDRLKQSKRSWSYFRFIPGYEKNESEY